MSGDAGHRGLRDRARARADEVVGRTEEILAEAYGDSAAEVHGEALLLRAEAEQDAALDDAALADAPAGEPPPPDALVRAVQGELTLLPRLDARAVAVGADGASVRLRGTVATAGQRRAAVKAARAVPGVHTVDDGLHVEPLPPLRRPEAHLRASVLRALLEDPVVPASVDARVAGGRVTLTGTVEWDDQRDAALRAAGAVDGVRDVADELRFTDTTHIAVDVENGIRREFVRRARLHADGVTVVVGEGTVTLLGQVRCEDERGAAVAAAWASPSVRAVDDRLAVAPA